MKKHKKLIAWGLVLLSLLFMTVSIILQLNYGKNNGLLVLVTIAGLFFVFSLQFAITQTFRFKPKPKKYVSETYEFDLDESIKNLETNQFKKRDTNSGYSYIKIMNRTAYKVTFITNAAKYLEETEQKNSSPMKGLNSCEKFIGFEIFLDSNEKILNTVVDFSFCGKNLYYEAFFIDVHTGLLVEPNIIKVNDEFNDNVQKFKEIIKIVK